MPDTGPPEVWEPGSFESLGRLVRKNLELDGQVFPFYGAIVRITEPPYRYLIHPDGSRLRLFNLPDSLAVDYGHRLGGLDSWNRAMQRDELERSAKAAEVEEAAEEFVDFLETTWGSDDDDDDFQYEEDSEEDAESDDDDF